MCSVSSVCHLCAIVSSEHIVRVFADSAIIYGHATLLAYHLYCLQTSGKHRHRCGDWEKIMIMLIMLLLLCESLQKIFFFQLIPLRVATMDHLPPSIPPSFSVTPTFRMSSFTTSMGVLWGLFSLFTIVVPHLASLLSPPHSRLSFSLTAF